MHSTYNLGELLENEEFQQSILRAEHYHIERLLQLVSRSPELAYGEMLMLEVLIKSIGE